MEALLTKQIPHLPPPKRGKVREVYDLGTSVLIVATDRISAFDVIMKNGIPDKGRILNQMSAFWFEELSGVCPNHVITTDDSEIFAKLHGLGSELAGRCTIAKKAVPLKIECVARGYLSGSLYNEYRNGGGNVHGLELPPGLGDSSELPEPIFTPATKADQGHDMNISFEEACNIVGKEVAITARNWTLELFRRASFHACSVGLILADTKFEFGLTDQGLIWIDEALTPDSSRFWPITGYRPGQAQPSFDKQFVRDYLESIHWDKTPPGPELPVEVVKRTQEKYKEAFRLVVGREFGSPASG